MNNLDNFKCLVINTACVTNESCDLLVIDEVHGSIATHFRKLFNTITYTYFLGLTATIERLDGKEALLLRHFPIADQITREEAIANGWLSNYVEYKVLLQLPDREEYNKANADFQKHFEFFNRDFETVSKFMRAIKLKQFALIHTYAKSKNTTYKAVMGALMSFQRALKVRMAIVAENPKKIEVANKLIKLLSDRKGLVFSYSIESAKQIAGHQFHSKLSDKKRKQALEVFNQLDTGFLSSVKALDLGVDVKNLSTAIILYGSSSKIQKAQRLKA